MNEYFYAVACASLLLATGTAAAFIPSDAALRIAKTVVSEVTDIDGLEASASI